MANNVTGLFGRLRKAINSNPAALAFIQGEQVISYEQLDRLLRAAMRLLKEQGVGRGDRVGLSMGQSPFHCMVMIALAGLGALSVPLHPALLASTRSTLAARYGIRFLVCRRQEFRIDGLQFIHMETLDSVGDEMQWDAFGTLPDAATPFRVALSSGTSGDPKGTLLTHGQLLDRIGSTLFACDASSRVIPFDINFALGFVYAIGTLTAGGTVVFPREQDPPSLMSAILLHAVTHVSISPARAIKLIALLQASGIAFPSLRHLRLVGSTPQVSLIRALLSKASPNVYVPYGLTEVGPVSMASPDILAEFPDCAGKVLPGVEVEIVDDHGEKQPSGVSGEIRVRVDGMPTGYYMDKEQTQIKFRSGWLYPGDRGRLSADGLLFVVGRIDDILDLDGHMVNPNYVEEILCAHPAVAEAAVFAHRNQKTERLMLVAAIIPRTPPPQQQELAQYASQQLGVFGAPSQFVFVQDFPRTPSGKLDRKALASNIKLL